MGPVTISSCERQQVLVGRVCLGKAARQSLGRPVLLNGAMVEGCLLIMWPVSVILEMLQATSIAIAGTLCRQAGVGSIRLDVTPGTAFSGRYGATGGVSPVSAGARPTRRTVTTSRSEPLRLGEVQGAPEGFGPGAATSDRRRGGAWPPGLGGGSSRGRGATATPADPAEGREGSVAGGSAAVEAEMRPLPLP